MDDCLTEEQIERCYDVFDCYNDEFISAAWFLNGQLIIQYTSHLHGDIEITEYEPDLSDEEGQAKLKYILTGEGEYNHG